MSPYKNFEDQQRNQREYYQKNKEEKREYSKQRHLINREENLKKMRERYRNKKGSTKKSLESISLSGEIWKSIVVDGKVHPWYSVSTMGRVASHFGNKPKSASKYVPGRGAGFKGWDRSYDPEYCRLIKPAPSYKNNHDPNKRNVYGNKLKVGDRIIMCTRVSIRFPWNFFKDINMYGSEYQYPIQGLESNMNGKCCQRTMAIHKLVANTHMSVDDFPPERIADTYDDIHDFIITHYTLSPRPGAFWDEMRSIGIKEKHHELIRQKYVDQRNSFAGATQTRSLFPDYMWLQMAVDWDIDVSDWPMYPKLNSTDIDFVEEYINKMETTTLAACNRFPNNYAFLKETVFNGG